MTTLSRRYAAALRYVGSCPVESGHILKLADHECSHGRLPMEGPSCGCFPGQEPPAARQLPRRNTATTTQVKEAA